MGSWKTLAWMLLPAALAASIYAAFAHGFLRCNYPSAREFPVQGVDVSHHQGSVDWDALSAQGVAFAYLKATEGADFRDPRFRHNWTEAVRAGITPGAYHFFTFCRPAREQARNLLEALPRTERMLPPAVDVEFGGNCTATVEPEVIREELRALLGALEQAVGTRPVVYLTREAYEALWDGRFSGHPVWIRDIYGRPELPEGSGWSFWQYANRGRLEGIEGPVDLNVFAGDREAFEALLVPARSGGAAAERPGVRG